MRIVNLLLLAFLFTILSGCMKSMAKENPVEAFSNLRSTGASAHDFLASDIYRKLTVEIQYMPGNEPKKDAIKELKQFLTQYLDKPDGISVTVSEIPAASDSVLSLEEITAIEKRYRTSYTKGTELAAYILITNGYSYNKDALGIAYRNTSMVLLGKHIANHSDKFKKPSRSDLQSRVMQHEFGHLLGLVNTGTSLATAHQDVEHDKHCKNKWCLMYYLTDTDDYPSILLKKDPPKLDEECVNDLKAKRELTKQ